MRKLKVRSFLCKNLITLANKVLSWDGGYEFRNVSEGEYTISSELVYTTEGEAQALVGTAYPTFEFYGPGQDVMGDGGKGSSRSQGMAMPYGSRYLSPYQTSER